MSIGPEPSEPPTISLPLLCPALSCSYGQVEEMVIPRPAADPQQPDPPGVGLVYLRYTSLAAAAAARSDMDQRLFEDRVVAADLFEEAQFAARALD